MQKTIVRFLLIPGCLLAFSACAELLLVEKGEARMPIVVFENAPPFTRRAADELAEYIEKVSGARPEVLEGEPRPLPEKAIWVGYQPVMNELFPDTDFEFQHPEEILITAGEDHLAVLGRDCWDPKHMRVEFRRRTVNGVQREYGTVNAVYTFIQDYLDVRWLWPGDLGVDVIERDRIAFAPFEYRYHPPIRHRSGLLYLSALRSRSGNSHEWCRFQRLQLDSLFVLPSSHGFTDWWERFGESHPEYFALQPDGTRSGYPSPRTVKICQSNPDVWEQWIDDVEKKLEANPNLTSFDAGPNDGWSTGHCVCENCLEWDHPEGELRRFNWQGMAQDYVALSDRDVTFYNHLGRLLKERFPDRKLFVRGSAYGHTRPAPIEAVPDDNVLITSVANFLLWSDRVDRGSSRSTTHRKQFGDWGKVAPNMGWRPNITGWVRRGLPNMQLTSAMDDFRFAAEHDAISVTIDTFPEFWATQGPMYYMLAKLAWDPDQDEQALIADYYQRGFGKAAGTIARYWEHMEERAIAMTELYREGNRDYSRVYDAGFLQKASGLLDKAASQVADEPQRFARRVEFLRAGLEYTSLYLNLLDAMERYNKSGQEDVSASEEARDIWDEFHRLSKEHPYAIHWQHIRPIRSIMQDLHPDGRSGDPAVD